VGEGGGFSVAWGIGLVEEREAAARRSVFAEEGEEIFI
jgi:hypothetical protein